MGHFRKIQFSKLVSKLSKMISTYILQKGSLDYQCVWKGLYFSAWSPTGTFFGPYFSGSIFSVLWVTFDPTGFKYADHQNRWIAKYSPHVVLGPYFCCLQGSLFIKCWVPMRSLFLSLYFFHCRSIPRSPLFSLPLGCSYLELWEQ